MCCTFVTWPAVHWNRLDSATWCDLSDQEIAHSHRRFVRIGRP